MDVYWLEQKEADVPAAESWLNAGETIFLNAMPFAKRRNDWRLGRWTAKNALARYLGLSAEPHSLASIEIRPMPSGVPELYLQNKPYPGAVSLSHRSGIAICALAPTGRALGCDLEVIEERSDAFFADYFSADEQSIVSQASPADRSWLLALLWSAKESVLKALGQGLRLDTRCVVIEAFDDPGQNRAFEDRASVSFLPEARSSSGSDGWGRLRLRHTEGQIYHGWWQREGKLVRTLVGSPQPNPPILLIRERGAITQV